MIPLRRALWLLMLCAALSSGCRQPPCPPCAACVRTAAPLPPLEPDPEPPPLSAEVKAIVGAVAIYEVRRSKIRRVWFIKP